MFVRTLIVLQRGMERTDGWMIDDYYLAYRNDKRAVKGASNV